MKAVHLVLAVTCVGAWFQGAHAVDWNWPWSKSWTGCHSDKDCGIQAKCDIVQQACYCLHSSRTYKAVYDAQLKRCLSLVGKMCNRDDDLSNTEQLSCVENAECRRNSFNLRASREVFGVCQCKPGFEETDKHLCTRAYNWSQASSAGNRKWERGSWALGASLGVAAALVFWVWG